MNGAINIGIDAGGTLVKVAYWDNRTLQFIKFSSLQLESVVSWLQVFNEVNLCITGGKAALLKSMLLHETTEIIEFEATCRGVRYLLGKNGIQEEAFIITNVGTGTSIHYVDQFKQQRIGGTGVGGGTLIGLSRLLTGLSDYDQIVSLAANGDREQIDLKVSHIYEGAEPPIPGDLTASNFGRLLEPGFFEQPYENLLASVIGVVGETVSTISVFAAGQYGVPSIIFIGSSLVGNDLLKEVISRYTILRGATPVFIENGEFCGAIGALLELDQGGE